jgi:hypothetical protein
MVTQALKLAGIKYESFEVLQNEIKAFIGESMDMPTLKQLSHSRRFDLITGIIDSGGSCKVADKMGLTFQSASARRNQNNSQISPDSTNLN